jgi:hypothetical protein
MLVKYHYSYLTFLIVLNSGIRKILPATQIVLPYVISELFGGGGRYGTAVSVCCCDDDDKNKNVVAATVAATRRRASHIDLFLVKTFSAHFSKKKKSSRNVIVYS